MSKLVEVHVVVCVPCVLDGNGEVTRIDQPYTCDENPFCVFDGETYVVDDDGSDEEYTWRTSTDAEIGAAYDVVSALLFKRGER